MELWDPAAQRDALPDAGPFVAGPYRIVLHSTEGATYASARAAYVANKVSPHFTVSYEHGRLEVWQHVALNRASTALMHPAGAVHTNRQSAIQVEVVAYASKPVWVDGLVMGVADLISWVSRQCGVAPVAPPFEAYPASYGAVNGVRFTDAVWLAFNGVCGHMHVPGNLHGDPGAIPILRLVAQPPPAPPPTIPTGSTHDYEEAATKTTMVHCGPLDASGNGWADWQPGLGRDPIIVGVTLLGPSPPDDGYWDQQKNVTLAAQPRGGAVRLTVRGGTPGDTVTAWVTVS